MSIKQQIETKLSNALPLTLLEVSNESHMHSVPPGSETHFKVVLVSAEFVGKRPVARHQLIYRVLADELAGPVHALALHTYTAEEWQQRNGAAPVSPECMGGSKHGGTA
jgi:BolA protein